jgi:hypothetical protein
MKINLTVGKYLKYVLMIALATLVYILWRPLFYQLSENQIKLFSEVGLVLATLGLVYATLVLARHSKRLSDFEQNRQRTSDIKRCITLATEIINLPRDIGAVKTDKAGQATALFNELLTFGNYFSKSYMREKIEIVSSLLNLWRATGIKEHLIAYQKKIDFIELNTDLMWQIWQWQIQLGNYTGEGTYMPIDQKNSVGQ